MSKECCFDVDINAGLGITVIGGVQAIALTIKDKQTNQSGKFKFTGAGVGALVNLTFRVGRLTVCCSVEDGACPTLAAFNGVSASVTTGSLSFIAGGGFTRIKFKNVLPCGDLSDWAVHGELGALGIGIGQFWGTITPR